VSEQDFLAKWSELFVGIALYGTMRLFPDDGPLIGLGKLHRVPARIEELLKKCYADAQPAAPTPTRKV
jgi:hypothetical protein